MMAKGWCPSLHAPMASGDGLLVRLRPPGGVLTAVAARTLAEASARHGNGAIELTSRAAIQIRGLRTETVAPFAAGVIAAGLADADPAAERRRTVIAPPLAGDDPAAHPRAAEVVRTIEAALVQDARLATLPDKFCVVVDAGGVLPTGAAPSDIHVRLSAQGDSALLLLDGSDLAAPCPLPDIPGAVTQLATAFLASRRGHRRMRALVCDIGAAAVFAAAGIAPTIAAPRPSTPNALGWLPYAGASRGAFGIGLPFGATNAPTLIGLADLADRHGDGRLRLTPWRAFVVARVASPKAVKAEAEKLGLIVAPDDPRARIFACPGAPACASASVRARTDAARLSALRFAGTIHVSGCAKGCAHPAAADLTLVGDNGRYAVIRHGRTADAALCTIATIDDILESAPA